MYRSCSECTTVAQLHVHVVVSVMFNALDRDGLMCIHVCDLERLF